ncbi:MAG: hypothetical protein RJA07_2227 [Bacteroidota bacterium]|jgi:hypothetical protein
MKKLITLGAFALLSTAAFSQEATTPTNDQLNSDIQGIKSDIASMKKLKISGYVQTQVQFADSMNVNSFEGGNFSGNDKRFAVRRGRIKFDYSNTTPEGIVRSQYVFQMDMSEGGFAVKDAYAKFTEPYTNWFSVTMGIQNRPFGFEVPFSSSLRESPERGRMSQILFPQERDLGAMITLEGPKTSRWNWLKIQGGLFNGNGNATKEYKFTKDVIGQIILKKSFMEERLKISGGASYYNGSVLQGNSMVFNPGTLSDGTNALVLDATKVNANNFSKRQYTGLDAQVSFDSKAGLTTIRGEYIYGTQPSAVDTLGYYKGKMSWSQASTTSPNSALIPGTVLNAKANVLSTTATYNRNFSGLYIYVVQNIMHSKHDVFVKYDVYDPNTKVAGSDIVSSKTINTVKTSTNLTVADIKFATLGLGYIYHFDENVKFTLYYAMVTNENTGLANFTRDIKDNIFTVRMQYKF